MSEAQSIIIVPGRKGSTRLKNKLLLNKTGKPLLIHTLEQCALAQESDAVIAAVDSLELKDIAEQKGFPAILTSNEHKSGTDRVWEAAQHFPNAQFIINVQGDEPEIDPSVIDSVLLELKKGEPAVTLSAPLEAKNTPDPSSVKVVTSLNNYALYFSRSKIPFRNEAKLHIGVYGFQRKILEQFSKLPPSPLELAEKLEQLRLLENSIPIKVINCPHTFPGIDTQKDYDMFCDRFKAAPPNND